MIGKLLAILTPDEEARVLTTVMQPGAYSNRRKHEGPCLVGTALDAQLWAGDMAEMFSSLRQLRGRLGFNTNRIEGRYDALCKRFGNTRVNDAIRTRILSNMAQRALQHNNAATQQYVDVLPAKTPTSAVLT